MVQLDLFGLPVATPDPHDKRPEKKTALQEEPVLPAVEAATMQQAIAEEVPPPPPASLPPDEVPPADLPAADEPVAIDSAATTVILPQQKGPVVFDDGIISVKIKSKISPAVEVAKTKKEKIIRAPQKKGRKSFKEIDAEVDLIEVPDDEILFQKQYYPISQVAKWFRVNASLIRFWENEFDILRPKKNGKGDRLFRPEDVKNLQLIYQLLRQRKYTIEGAREYMKTNRKKADVQLQLTQTLQKFKSFLLDLKANLQA